MNDGLMKEHNYFDLLYPKLRDYLESQDIKINKDGFFKCICHPDTSPSMSLGGKSEYLNTVAHCFGCQRDINIFHAINILEGLPLTGIDFYQITLPELCKRYNIQYEPVQIDNKTRDIYQKRSAVRDASNIVYSMCFTKNILNTEHNGIKFLLNRGITEESIRKHKLGIISDFDNYINQMNTIGYTDTEWLASVDLTRKDIFTKDGIIIPIYDDKNRPIGFVTRTTNIDPNGKGDRKYCNSVNSDIYNKSEVLFNFNNYRPENGPLWIVEGYLDAIILDQYGIHNVAALGSTALTEQHVDLLSRYNIKNIIICLDGDTGGNTGTKLALERVTPYQIFKSIRVVELPDGEDPDSYIRKSGIDSLKKLSHPDTALSPFAWTLKHTSFQDDPIVVVEQAIPAIAAEESSIKRLRMIKELAKITGISKDDIRKDVDLKVNKESDKFIEELSEINKYVQTSLNKRKIKDTKSILDEALIKVKNLEVKFNNTIDNRSCFDDKRNNFFDKIENGEFKYGLYTNKFKKFEEKYDGIPYTTNLILVGGKPSSGKSIFLNSLAIDLVESNEDAAVFYMSIDDTIELMSIKTIAQKTGYSTSKIKNFINLDSKVQSEIRDARNWLDRLSSRYIMVDAHNGTNSDALESNIEWFVKEFPNKKKVFFLDNFHKLTLPANKQKTDAVAYLSEKVKDFTRLYDLTMFATVELRKGDTNESRPTPNDLKDTVQLEYDADSVIMIHNDLLVKEDTNIIWQGTYGDEGTKAMPYIEMRIFKNKHTGKTGSLVYRLNTYNLRVDETSFAEVSALMKNPGHEKISLKTNRKVF